MAGEIPPLFTISDDDHGGYVAVASYTLLILMVGFVATRVFTRWYIVRSIKADDYFLVAAATFGILQSVFIQLALDHGLGRKRSTISDSDFDFYQKYEYAAQISLVATISCAKISLALLIRSLMAEGYSILAGKGLLIVIVAWAVSSILALGFQCNMPAPWDFGGVCLDQDALHVSISVLSIVTDGLLILLPCIVVWKIHLRTKRRNRILALFATRIIVCISTGVELHYYSIFNSSTDRTWTNTYPSIWSQTTMNLSIIFTAIPSLGRLLVELQPAVNAFAITDQHGLRPHDKYALSSLARRFSREFVVRETLGVQNSVLGSRAGKEGKGKESKGSKDRECVKGMRDSVGKVKGMEEGINRAVDFNVY